MKVLNGTPFPFAPLVGRVRHPGPTVTLVVKGTFSLRHEGAVEPVEEQPLPDGDQFVGDDEDRGVRYPSDFAHYKPRADVMLVGRCWTPDGEEMPFCRVTYSAGRMQRTLLVQGDSYWKRKYGLGVPDDPAPFTSLDLGWENAYGGPGHEWNPAGKGIAPVETDSGGRRVPLPNVQDPDRLVTSRNARVGPAGFGPVHSNWKPRAAKVGTYKGKWAKQRWPYYPEDFDWTWYNAAPEAMQYEGYLRGDEDIYLENLHPDMPEFHTKLPGIRIRCFLDEILEDGETELREVTMNLDTLWVDNEAQVLTLVWRGIEPIRDEELDDYENVVILQEALAETEKPLEACEKAKLALLEEDAGEGPPARAAAEVPLEEEIAAEEAAMLEQIPGGSEELDKAKEEAGPQDPEKEAEIARELSKEHDIPEEDLVALFAPAISVERVLERYAAGEPFTDENLQGLDLSKQGLKGIVLKNAQLSGADLSHADLSGADLSGAVLREANLSGANLSGADLSKSYLSGANLENARLEKAKLDSAMLSEARIAGAVLRESTAEQADLTGADLTGADLEEIVWKQCDLVEAKLKKAKFEGAILQDCDLSGCHGTEAAFDEADLTGARFTEDARLDGASFRNVHAPGSMWETADLEEADFSRAQLTRADFSKTNLQGAVFRLARARQALFDRADLREADLREADGFRGSFERADLSGADLRGANLYEAEFLDAVLDEADLERANIKATKLG